ncbi:dihydroorotate dehydrogenase electron transfer subunit [Methanospirillum lacunae]|uniref:Dihydroorotate dehydrogenase electron transfer subunit n=1 Tax=Methanospirillum lacunae TaxID=668570 RepID=A0A2V2MYZ8_9EURY|nr:dihydroorotate dehydrogenase electron transfer subunit [Methanospirillum lacunae]PWR73162.1 dihydroorotate dehydrogenase electron transfer subunit [Methanospirillum lacunae]
MSDNLPVMVNITRIVEESTSVKTVFFDKKFEVRPGQFVMVWVPGVDEIPMALSGPDSITVQEVGDATIALGNLKPGELIGIRGPFGNGFSPNGNILAIAGGVGAAPLLPLARQYSKITFLLGARSAPDLLYTRILSECTNLMIATDDGSVGYHGFVAGLLREMDLSIYDSVCVCGPELMMKSVLDVLDAKGALKMGQFSLHRYMKCGVGLCGSCCIDPEGLCVCRDGPVFRGDILQKSELGRYHRDACGRRS